MMKHLLYTALFVVSSAIATTAMAASDPALDADAATLQEQSAPAAAPAAATTRTAPAQASAPITTSGPINLRPNPTVRRVQRPPTIALTQPNINNTGARRSPQASSAQMHNRNLELKRRYDATAIPSPFPKGFSDGFGSANASAPQQNTTRYIPLRPATSSAAANTVSNPAAYTAIGAKTGSPAPANTPNYNGLSRNY